MCSFVPGFSLSIIFSSFPVGAGHRCSLPLPEQTRIHPLNRWWNLGCFHLLVIVTNGALLIPIHVFWGDIHAFPFCRCPRVELLGHKSVIHYYCYCLFYSFAKAQLAILDSELTYNHWSIDSNAGIQVYRTRSKLNWLSNIFNIIPS